MMDSLGEVGKKMRSAIKAKLVELGNASATGYIDDELPDYVMIMVANKRSKAQMTTDLQLFLGSNTEVFVNWLHQVLTKLQEVTLPNNLAAKSKKKTSESDAGASKKDKRDKRKVKKKTGKETSITDVITDVIAVELMEKAKKTLEMDPKTKNEGRTPSPPPAPQITEPDTQTRPRTKSPTPTESHKISNHDDFDIPSISEIQKTGAQSLHKKELSQLQELQNRIYEAKRKLKNLDSDSEDEQNAAVDNRSRRRSRSPNASGQKSSVLSRLGVKPTENSKPSNIISLSAIRRTEKEIYVAPSFRKLIEKQKEENDRRDERKVVKDRVSSRNRERRSRSPHERRDRPVERSSRERRDRRRSRSPIIKETLKKQSVHQRIGSRVIAAPSKNSHSDDDNEVVERMTVSSIVKVKPRPSVANTVQAGKNLLLKAVAEAQRSTTALAPQSRKKRERDNIVVQVIGRKEKVGRSYIHFDEEYVPESISTQSESEAEYHPSQKYQQKKINDTVAVTAIEDDGDDVIYLNNNEDVDLEDLEEPEVSQKSPQFVVTLEGAPSYDDDNGSKSPTPPPVIKRKSVKDRIGVRPVVCRDEDDAKAERPTKRRTEDGDEECESQRAYNKVKRARVSPIKFDLTDEECDGSKSRESSRERPDFKRSPTPENGDDKSGSDQNGEENAKRIKKLEPTRSFEHVPALLSSVAVPVGDANKSKTKERCKYYPSCSNAGCPFYHPTLPCKLFPICKFGDSCAYVHPKCKFDTSCTRIDCNFSHTQLIPSIAKGTLPPLASSIVPVQNYKSISITPNSTICKFFPNCSNPSCIFLHPKLCKFGKSCINKFDCNFYHFEMSSKNKFKWVSPLS